MIRRANRQPKAIRRERRKVVGEADDCISSEDWRPPISDYPIILSFLNECESLEREPPIDLLNEKLRSAGIGVSIGKELQCEEDFLEQLLAPYLTFEYERWGGDCPGRSGVYKTAYLTLGHTREVRRRLANVARTLAQWRQASGSGAGIADVKAKWAEIARREHAERQQRADEAKQWEKARAASWNAELLRQVREAAAGGGDRPFRRLNFLVHRGVVFYLDRGWCHSLGGDPHQVAQSLEEAGVRLVRCQLLTKIGWIPYFARCFDEALNVGWDDPNTRIRVASPEDHGLVVAAWRAWLTAWDEQRNLGQKEA